MIAQQYYFLYVFSLLLRSACAMNGGFVRPQGVRFALDGAPFTVVGANNYYLAYTDQDSVKDVFATAAKYGINVIRCWAYLQMDNSGVSAFESFSNGQVSVQNDALSQLDQLVSVASSYNIRLVLTLNNQWEAYGGSPMYNQWAGSTYHDAFFTDPRIIGWYQQYASALTQRMNARTGLLYKDDPTIFSWQLINEPRCKGSELPASPQCSCDTISRWAAQQAAFLQSLGVQQMISVGHEGFFAENGQSDWTLNGSEGVDAQSLATIEGIDYATFHLYPIAWNKDLPWTQQYIAKQLALAQSVNKPVVMEEFGWPNPSERPATYPPWIQPMCACGGSMVWFLAGRVGGSFYSHGDEFVLLDDGSDYNTKTLSILASC